MRCSTTREPAEILMAGPPESLTPCLFWVSAKTRGGRNYSIFFSFVDILMVVDVPGGFAPGASFLINRSPKSDSRQGSCKKTGRKYQLLREIGKFNKNFSWHC